jgi:peptidyl-tRNA hydrolase
VEFCRLELGAEVEFGRLKLGVGMYRWSSAVSNWVWVEFSRIELSVGMDR